MKKNIWRKLEIRVMWVLFIVISLHSIGIYLLMHERYNTLMIEELKDKALSVHKFLENELDERIFSDINTAEDENSELFLHEYNHLVEISQIANIKYVYTAKQNENGEVVYVVDGWYDRSNIEIYRSPGELFEIEFLEPLAICLNDEIVFGDGIRKTEWGILYITYFPFHDSDGNVIGAICMEFDCENLYNTMNRTMLITILFTVFNLNIFMVASFCVMKKVIKNTENVYVEMEESVRKSLDRIMLMLDTSPICAQIWDRELNTIDCNEAGVKLYGFKEKQEYAEKFISLCSPEYQPDGRRSDEKAVELVNKAFEEGYCIFDWMQKMPYDDILIPAEVSLVRAKYGEKEVVIGYTRDLREQYKMMASIEQQGKLLQAVNNTAVLLLNSDINLFESAMQVSMKIIADAVNVDCVYIWKNHTDDDGKLYCHQLFEWSEKGTIYATDDTMYAYGETFPGWYQALSKGEYKNGPINSMSAEVQELLSPAGIVSILIVPIFIKNEFWGFVGFDDFENERFFSKEEESILNSASVLFANALIRNNMINDIHESTQKLQEQDNLLKAVNQAAVMLLTTDEEDNFAIPLMASMELVGKSINADRVHIWRSEIIDGNREFFHEHSWLSEVGQQVMMVPSGIMTPYKDKAEWDRMLMSNEYIGGPISKMSKEEREYFVEFDIKSVIILPLYLDEQLWGLFSIDDCENEREFSESEIAILRSVSLMMVNAINRNTLVEKRTREIALQTATLTTLFDSIPDLIFTKDTRLRFTHCNKVFLEHFKKDREDFIGKNDAEVLNVSDEMIEWYKEKDILTMSNRATVTVEEVIPRADGANPIFETTKVPLVLNNEPIGILGIARDITERKEREKKVALHFEYAKKLTDALANITKSPTISAGDLKASADIIVEEGCKALNTHRVGIWSFEEGKGFLENISCFDTASMKHSVQENFDLMTRPEYVSMLQTERFLATNTAAECNFIFNEYGSGICAMLDAPIRIDGKLVGVVCAEQNICDEYLDERVWQIEEQNFASSLADLMALAISGYERKQAHTEADIANKSKSSFLANMSHEIRTPMNAILGTTEILIQHDELSVEIEEGLGKIYNSCDLLLGIINDILDLSKIEAGKMDITSDQYSTASLISDSVQLNLMRISSKSIEFELLIDENIPATLIGDELRIKQIMNNLLSNAFKYTEAGRITLSASYEPEEESDSGYFIISVQDSGYGMSKKQLGELFDEYSRFNQNFSKTIEGTGLGLAITQRLLYLMNGEIHVESELGKGSLFVVKLPQSRVDDEVLGAELAANLRHFRINYMTHRERRRVVRDLMPYGSVLVVDDVEANLYVAEGLLKLYKLQIDTVKSGREAINRINDGNVYDIVFMDHMMPEMDGMEATKRLRDMGYEAPIVALTANAVAGQAEIFLQNGFDEFISKPIDIRQLNLVLNKLIRDKQPPEVLEAIRAQKENANGNIADVPAKGRLLDREIPGMDLAKGLEQYDGNEEIFIKVLRSYTVSIRSMLDAINTISEDEITAYKIKVHGIKGASLAIYADEIGKAAGALEKAAKENDFEYIKENNSPLLEMAYKLVDGLSEMLSAIDSEIQKPLKAQPDKELLINLLNACKTYDMNNADKAMTEIEKYQYDSDDGLVNQLREYFDIMNYTEIVERLSYLEN